MDINLETAYRINQENNYPFGKTKRGAKKLYKSFISQTVKDFEDMLKQAFCDSQEWARQQALR